MSPSVGSTTEGAAPTKPMVASLSMRVTIWVVRLPSSQPPALGKPLPSAICSFTVLSPVASALAVGVRVRMLPSCAVSERVAAESA